MSEFGRNIKHIYLCHDNELNADYFGELIDKLKERNYSFISLADALKDQAYQREDYYIGPSGMSWFYRGQGSGSTTGIIALTGS